MDWSQIIFNAVLCGLVGWGTNKIAIHWLFHPLYPKHILGFRTLPPVQGVIPKNKEKLADAIAKAVSRNLLNQDVLRKELLSKEMTEKVSLGVSRFLERQRTSSQPLGKVLEDVLRKDNMDSLMAQIPALSENILESIRESDIASIIADKATDHLTRNSWLLSIFSDSIRAYLTATVTDLIQDLEAAPISAFISKKAEKLLKTPLNSLLQNKEDFLLRLQDTAVNAYTSFIENRAPEILNTIDIYGIVKKRIDEMDLEEVEKMTKDVINNQLQWLIWAGLFLGLGTGFLVSLVDQLQNIGFELF